MFHGGDGNGREKALIVLFVYSLKPNAQSQEIYPDFVSESMGREDSIDDGYRV